MEFLTVNEFAELLGIRPRTVRSWILRRQLTYFKVGRLVKIDSAEADRILGNGLRRAKEALPSGASGALRRSQEAVEPVEPLPPNMEKIEALPQHTCEAVGRGE